LQIRSAGIILWIVLCVISMNNLRAQTIIDDLQSQANDSDGVIRIECDSAIIALIGKPNSQFVTNGNTDYMERNGYRIQVFMGNDPKTAQSEANSKQLAIQTVFPELSAYQRYEAPNRKLLVGDFVTREEANVYIQRLRKEFPDFGKEMYIVTDKIRLFIER